MKKTVWLFCCLCVAQISFAQVANGKLQSLIDAENYFSSMVKTKGLKKAFLLVSDEETLIFRPGPVKALDYFEQQKTQSAYTLSWQPAFARIAKSGDWGFTTGPYETKNQQGESSYGQYVSVWRANRKGIWKLHLDLGVPHDRPLITAALDFREPSSNRFYRQPSVKRLQEREDVVMVTDRLLSATLNSKGVKTYQEFLSPKARLLLPGHQPLIGKEEILDFWSKQYAEISTTVQAVDRAYSGDWAYTRGTAQLKLNGQSKSYAYVRIWELQEGFNWNIVLEIFTPLAD